MEYVRPQLEHSWEGDRIAHEVPAHYEHALLERIRRGDGEEREIREAPELDPSSAGAAAVLLGGSALLLFDRRRRRAS